MLCKDIVQNFIWIALSATVAEVWADPDFDAGEGGEEHKQGNFYHYTADFSNFNIWVSIIVGFLGLIFMICVFFGCVHCCRKRWNRGIQGRDASSQNNIPKVITLTPPSYVSAEPPPYTAPDYSNSTATKQNNAKSHGPGGEGHQNPCFSLDVNTLPAVLANNSTSSTGNAPEIELHSVPNSEPPPAYESTQATGHSIES